jgi:hypothetical protein
VLATIAATLAGFHEGPNLLQLLSTVAAGGFAFWIIYLGSLGSKKSIRFTEVFVNFCKRPASRGSTTSSRLRPGSALVAAVRRRDLDHYTLSRDSLNE